MDYEHDPDAGGIPTFEWKCPICRYECLRYGTESLRLAKEEHLANHDKQDRSAAERATIKSERGGTTLRFSTDDKKFLKSIGIKVNYGE